MKKNIFIVILVLMVLGLGGYLVYDKVIDKDKKENKIESKIENEEDIKITSLTGTEIDEWMDKELKIDDIPFINFITYNNTFSKEIDTDNNLLDNNLSLKMLLTAKLSNMSYEIEKEDSNCNDAEDICISGAFAPKDEFLKAYQEIFGETLDISNLTVKDNKIMYYTRPTGVGIPQVKFKADKITYDDGIYTLILNVGILDDDSIDYNYNSGYSAKVKFSESDKYYKIISFVINK